MGKLKWLGFLVCLLFVQQLTATSTIDSLKALYPKQSNFEKASTLAELSYQLAFDDTKASIIYGQLAYQAASETGDQALIAQTLNDWSIPYLVAGNYDSVLVLSEKCLAIRTQLGDSVGMAKTLNKMANAQSELGQEEQSLKNNLLAIEIFNAQNLQVYSGRIYSNVASLYEGRGLYDLALDYYQKAKRMAKESNNMDAFYLAQINEGTCYTKLSAFSKAEVLLKESLQHYLLKENVEMIGSIYQGLGFNATQAGQILEAFDYYSLSLQHFEQNGSITGQALININLGNNLVTQKKYEAAEVYLNKGLNYSVQTTSIPQLQHAYKALTRFENLRGDYEKADTYFDLYQVYMDSMYNADTRLAIADMQVKHETDQKVKALEQEKLNKKNAQLWLAVATAAAALLLLFVFFIRHRKKISEQSLQLKALQNIEKERGRIARDLHDNLGADLTLITSKVDVQVFQQQDPNFKSDLEKISEISKSANAQLRDTIWSIHKSSLDLGELSSKISDFAQRIFDDRNIGIDIICENKKMKLPPAKALNLYRIAQEFMTNSSKYASAQNIEVLLSEHSIRLKDDGKGFDLESVKKGYGLNNISERVKELDGKSEWNSNSSGTELVIQF